LKQLLESRSSVSLYQGNNKDNPENAPRVPSNFNIEQHKEPKIDFKTWRSLRKRTLPNPFDYAFDILEWPSIEIARQLTLIESDLFKKIEPKECFGLGWSKSNKEDLSPNIVAITDRFNKMGFWIRNLFVNERDLKRRQALLLKFVDIIKELREMKNYTSIFQITSALNSAEVHRLKQTREVLTDKYEEIFKQASSLFENNFTGLSTELKYAAGSPTVPFQGVYLTDLTFIEDGNSNFITYKDKELINFTKRRYYSTTISDIQLLQQSSNYDYQPLPYLQYILSEDIFNNLELNEKALYQKSLQREARK
jgi:son of sevenless-like protein